MGWYGDMAVTTRPATEADAPRCAEIFLAGRIRAFHWQPAELFRLADYYDCVAEEEVWVAEVDGLVVGFVSIDRTERFVHNLFIDAAWQHQGIGTRLLNCAVRRLNGSARLKCLPQNQPARAFYERNGWVEDERGRAAMEPYVLYRK